LTGVSFPWVSCGCRKLIAVSVLPPIPCRPKMPLWKIDGRHIRIGHGSSNFGIAR
jgi:hypothetical protein